MASKAAPGLKNDDFADFKTHVLDLDCFKVKHMLKYSHKMHLEKASYLASNLASGLEYGVRK